MMPPETAHALGSTADTLTILRSRGRWLAKLVRTDRTIEGYDRARRFDLITVAVQGLDGLGGILRSLMGRPECCIVRGAVIDPSRTKGVRRLLYPDGESGDPPTLRDVPRCWVGLDIDGLPRSTKVAASDLAGCAAVVIETLPPEFRRAICIVQATASHRPATGTELKRWLRGVPVDHAVFGAAQIIYTASPLFAPGISDPFPERSTLIARDDSEVRAPQPSFLVEDRALGGTWEGYDPGWARARRFSPQAGGRGRRRKEHDCLLGGVPRG
jgi:hypothetical protein